MRLSIIVSLALAAAPAAVSAAGTLGYALGATNPDGTCKSQSDYEADMDTLKSKSTMIRGYSITQCDFAKNALPAAKNKGFKMILGVWPDVQDAFDKDKAALSSVVAEYADQIYAITVGSEALYRGSLTGSALKDALDQVRKLVPKNVKIGTADSWNKYADGTANPVVAAADIVLINAFSYWQGQEINNASHSFFDDIMQAQGKAQAAKGSIDGLEVWVGETGWPTAGTTYEAAIPTVDNAQRFYKEGICGMLAWGVSVFVFEAFDEPSKPPSIGQDGSKADETHWGVWDAQRKLKYSIDC